MTDEVARRLHAEAGRLRAAGRRSEAIEPLSKALRRAPMEPRWWLELADDHQELDQHAEAIGAARSWFQRALLIDRDDAFVHRHLGWLLRRLGELDSAVEHLTAAIALEPEAALTHLYLGETYEACERPDLAEEQCRAACALAPEWSFPHRVLGNLLRAQDRLEEAEAAYREALARDPRDDVAARRLARLLRPRGAWAEAEPWQRRAEDDDA